MYNRQHNFYSSSNVCETDNNVCFDTDKLLSAVLCSRRLSLLQFLEKTNHLLDSRDRIRPPLLTQTHVFGTPSITPQISPMHSPLRVQSAQQRRYADKPFRSTSLEDRSRTPSPRRSPRLQPKEYYGTHELYRRSRSPSPCAENQYASIGRRTNLPTKNLPELARSPTLPNYQNFLIDNGGTVFPRLCTSPTQSIYYPESPMSESDLTIYETKADQNKYAPFKAYHHQQQPSVNSKMIENIQFSPPYQRANLINQRLVPADCGPVHYRSQQQMSPGSFGEPESRIFNDPFEDRPPMGSGHMINGNQSTRLNVNGVGHLRPQNHPSVIRAQPGNIPLSDSEQEDWC